MGINEKQFLDQIEHLLSLFGWRWIHFRPARIEHGWRTALSGHQGFPDLILVRDCVILAIELKSEKGKVTSTQEEWLSALSKAGITTYVWRPSDWDDILRCLSNDPKTTSTIQGMRDMPSDIPD